MQKEDEEEYLAYCSDAMFRIHILELRLNRSVNCVIATISLITDSEWSTSELALFANPRSSDVALLL